MSETDAMNLGRENLRAVGRPKDTNKDTNPVPPDRKGTENTVTSNREQEPADPNATTRAGSAATPGVAKRSRHKAAPSEAAQPDRAGPPPDGEIELKLLVDPDRLAD